MTSSNFGLKIGNQNQNCRRKLTLDSNDAEYHADSENVLYVTILFIDRRERASAHVQKRIIHAGCFRTR